MNMYNLPIIYRNKDVRDVEYSLAKFCASVRSSRLISNESLERERLRMIIGRVFSHWWNWFCHLFWRSRKIHPTFCGSFIQYWYCQNWDYYRWVKEFRMLQKIGINEIILQNIVDINSRYAVYPTAMEGYSSNSIDMVETCLAAADGEGMNVRIGLGFNDEWWSIDGNHKNWLAKEADENIAIFTEVLSKYFGHQSLTGWYIPHEFHPLMALSFLQRENLNRFYKKIANFITGKSTKTIMIAPFYNARLSGPVTLALWSDIVHDVFKGTGIHIMALQDSVGAGFNTLNDLDEIYASTRRATEEMGLHLYAVTETFMETAGRNRPAPLHRIYEQLSKVAPYVNRCVAFSIDHYQNGSEPTQVTDYEDYYQYYLKHHK